LDNHQIAHADQSDKLSGSANVIILRIQGKASRCRDQASVARLRLRRLVLVQRGPGAEVVPSEVGGQTEDARLGFSLGRAGLEDRIVDADVFALRVELSKSFRELARAIGGGNLFEERSGVGKM